jgi:hypothetical protein
MDFIGLVAVNFSSENWPKLVAFSPQKKKSSAHQTFNGQQMKIHQKLNISNNDQRVLFWTNRIKFLKNMSSLDGTTDLQVAHILEQCHSSKIEITQIWRRNK